MLALMFLIVRGYMVGVSSPSPWSTAMPEGGYLLCAPLPGTPQMNLQEIELNIIFKNLSLEISGQLMLVSWS